MSQVTMRHKLVSLFAAIMLVATASLLCSAEYAYAADLTAGASTIASQGTGPYYNDTYKLTYVFDDGELLLTFDDDASGGAAEHFMGIFPDGDHSVGVAVQGDDRGGLVDDTPVPSVNQDVRGTQINAQVRNTAHEKLL